MPYIRLTVLSLSLFAGNNVVADDVTIPNTFTAGTPARAAEVNDNFAAVEASVDDNAADVLANAANVAANLSDIQANRVLISALEDNFIDTRARLIDSTGVEVGRVNHVDSSNTFVVTASLAEYSGILRWNPNSPDILTFQSPQTGTTFFDGPCGSGGTTAISEDPFVTVAGLLPIITGHVYAVDTSTSVTFNIDYALQVDTNGVGCRDITGSSARQGFALVDLGTPWTPPFSVR